MPEYWSLHVSIRYSYRDSDRGCRIGDHIWDDHVVEVDKGDDNAKADEAERYEAGGRWSEAKEGECAQRSCEELDEEIAKGNLGAAVSAPTS
jgi:hypothetical protein